MFKEKKAQVSLEYLIILGGIIFVTAIIGLYLKTTANTIGEEIKEESS